MGKLTSWLHNNILTKDRNDYSGKIKPAGTIGSKEIATLMTKEGIELKELLQ